MCGLVGVWSPSEPVDRSLLVQRTERLGHRGPDGSGVWIHEAGHVALGHTRLAILDVAGGQQPLHSEDGRVSAVVNGELYNDAEQRRLLEGRGHRLATTSDSELLVHLYEDHGLAAVQHLRGEFAFVLTDGERLVAARDRFGVRPLFYRRDGHTVWLASEARVLDPDGLDLDAVQQCASFQYLLPGQTPFRGVRSVPPGHQLVVDADGLRVERWFHPDEGTETRPLLDVLSAAVDRRMRSDVPLGVLLSGGLDSAAVAALAARHGPLPTFTVCFDRPPWDERDVAKEVAAHLGLPWHPLVVTEQDLADVLPSAIRAAGTFVINAHVGAKQLLARHVRAHGVRAVLTGEGADEMLLGYAFFRHDLLDASGREALSASESTTRGMHVPSGQSLSTAAFASAWGRVPGVLAAKATLGHRMHQLLRPELRPHDPAATLVQALTVSATHPVRQTQQVWLQTGLPAYVLGAVGDPQMLAHAVEDRTPFLDLDLWRWSRDQPVSHLIQHGVEKQPLRDAMRGLLPDVVRTRPKRPFLAPPLTPGGPLHQLAHDTLHGDLPDFLDPVATRALLERWTDDPVVWDPVVWMAVSAVVLAA